jgi:hypothetical protein
LTYLLPAIPWTFFIVATIAFVLHTRIWKEFQQDIEDLHDIPSQGMDDDMYMPLVMKLIRNYSCSPWYRRGTAYPTRPWERNS